MFDANRSGIELIDGVRVVTEPGCVIMRGPGMMHADQYGAWLIPDDGFDGRQSQANTLRVQQACRKELNALK
ncbi:MAG TPA: hypothetical protein VKB05_16810 [Pyrinomonadaceae bacterium]|nr:hypothetical protein [Pyrinomonadaceae bacterium]